MAMHLSPVSKILKRLSKASASLDMPSLRLACARVYSTGLSLRGLEADFVGIRGSWASTGEDAEDQASPPEALLEEGTEGASRRGDWRQLRLAPVRSQAEHRCGLREQIELP